MKLCVREMSLLICHSTKNALTGPTFVV